MYCKHCGREIDVNSSYCKYCGKAQDNRVSASNGIIDFVTNKPIVSSYILWVIANIICLCSGEKDGHLDYILYPKFEYSNSISPDHYQITDFIVYAILIPLVLFLGYHYFNKVTSIKKRILWAVWFILNILWYNWSTLEIAYDFFPFSSIKYAPLPIIKTHYVYPYISYHAYDLSELVFYTMIIPIAYWGYLYYKDKKKK